MYLKSIYLENVGPLDKLDLPLLPFSEEGHPKPIIIVGENGTGKSIVLSYIVNALIAAKQLIYENAEVTSGRVYKSRSPSYIKNGKSYYFSKLVFEQDLECIELQLNQTKLEFEETNEVPSIVNDYWNELPINETSLFSNNYFSKIDNIREIFNQNCILFFPTNRFEEPAWLNLKNLQAKASLTEIEKISGYSNRIIVTLSNLKNICDWILDNLYDSQVFESKVINLSLGNSFVDPLSITPITYYEGSSTNIVNEVSKILNVILSCENLMVSVGRKFNRVISVYKDGEMWIPNLFQLSTGQSSLLTIFGSILRDYDLTNQQINSTKDIKGIVLIDEVDLHLHTHLKRNILPKLIKIFPRVQFIITTHSPLFLLGMQEEFTEDGFQIINLPNGKYIAAEDFREFDQAYNSIKKTVKFKKELERVISESRKPILFVEGYYDIHYIKKASILLNKSKILDQFRIEDGDGYGNLDKIWNSFKQKNISKIYSNKILLLYDCDTEKQDRNQEKIFKRVIPLIEDNPIKKGIENLFPSETLEKAKEYKTAFVDVTSQIKKTVRGQEITEPEKMEINKDEKKNFCQWLCCNGNSDDFKHFMKIFKILEEVLDTTI